MTIGENIKRIRQEKGLTQKQLGNLCNPPMADSAIRRYEAGKANPKTETLCKIADALGVPEYELRGLDGSIRVNSNPEREKLDEEAQKIFIKQMSGEKITEEESQKVSDYIERVKESYDKLNESIKDYIKIIGKYLNENTQMPEEIAQTLKENLQKLTDLTPTMPDFYENLNDIGREKAAEQIDMLAKIPEYQKEPDEPPQD
ncbi:helix-turn-helix domain-containing protein [Lachnospiraceae bacterium JLR.KK009]